MDQAFAEELEFWVGYLTDIDRNYLATLTSSHMPVEPSIARLIGEIDAPRTPIRALDIGCGPLSILGRMANGLAIEVTGLDPLVAEYGKILDALKISRPFKAVAGGAEDIRSLFPPQSFDFVFSRNALDHSQDAIAAIGNALWVCRPGGIVHFIVFPCEGRHAGYAGLHQWDFDLKDGSLWITGVGREPVELKEIIGEHSYSCERRLLAVDDYLYQIETTIRLTRSK